MALCCVCGRESAGEVCNTCIRTETQIMKEEWVHKEGLLGSKKIELNLSISDLRISGYGLITTQEGMLTTGRYDNFTHYIKNIEEVKSVTIDKKEALLIHIVNPYTRLNRFIYMLSPKDVSKLILTIKSL